MSFDQRIDLLSRTHKEKSSGASQDDNQNDDQMNNDYNEYGSHQQSYNYIDREIAKYQNIKQVHRQLGKVMVRSPQITIDSSDQEQSALDMIQTALQSIQQYQMMQQSLQKQQIRLIKEGQPHLNQDTTYVQYNSQTSEEIPKGEDQDPAGFRNNLKIILSTMVDQIFDNRKTNDQMQSQNKLNKNLPIKNGNIAMINRSGTSPTKNISRRYQQENDDELQSIQQIMRESMKINHLNSSQTSGSNVENLIDYADNSLRQEQQLSNKSRSLTKSEDNQMEVCQLNQELQDLNKELDFFSIYTGNYNEKLSACPKSNTINMTEEKIRPSMFDKQRIFSRSPKQSRQNRQRSPPHVHILNSKNNKDADLNMCYMSLPYSPNLVQNYAQAYSLYNSHKDRSCNDNSIQGSQASQKNDSNKMQLKIPISRIQLEQQFDNMEHNPLSLQTAVQRSRKSSNNSSAQDKFMTPRNAMNIADKNNQICKDEEFKDELEESFEEIPMQNEKIPNSLLPHKNNCIDDFDSSFEDESSPRNTQSGQGQNLSSNSKTIGNTTHEFVQNNTFENENNISCDGPILDMAQIMQENDKNTLRWEAQKKNSDQLFRDLIIEETDDNTPDMQEKCARVFGRDQIEEDFPNYVDEEDDVQNIRMQRIKDQQDEYEQQNEQDSPSDEEEKYQIHLRDIRSKFEPNEIVQEEHAGYEDDQDQEAMEDMSIEFMEQDDQEQLFEQQDPQDVKEMEAIQNHDLFSLKSKQSIQSAGTCLNNQKETKSPSLDLLYEKIKKKKEQLLKDSMVGTISQNGSQNSKSDKNKSNNRLVEKHYQSLVDTHSQTKKLSAGSLPTILQNTDNNPIIQLAQEVSMSPIPVKEQLNFMTNNVIQFDQEDHALSTDNKKFDPNTSLLSGVSVISEVSIINDDPQNTSISISNQPNSKKKPKKNFLLINKSMTTLRNTGKSTTGRGSDKKINNSKKI